MNFVLFGGYQPIKAARHLPVKYEFAGILNGILCIMLNEL